MRKICLLLGIIVLLGGCSSEESIGSTGKHEEVSNFSVEVEGTQAFARVGAEIEVPVGAENARYYIISGQIAEIQFSLDGVQYNYQASQNGEAVTDVQDQESVQAVVGDVLIPIQISDGRHLAAWKWGAVWYRLATDDPVDEGIMKSLVEELARETMPGQV